MQAYCEIYECKCLLHCFLFLFIYLVLDLPLWSVLKHRTAALPSTYQFCWTREVCVIPHPSPTRKLRRRKKSIQWRRSEECCHHLLLAQWPKKKSRRKPWSRSRGECFVQWSVRTGWNLRTDELGHASTWLPTLSMFILFQFITGLDTWNSKIEACKINFPYNDSLDMHRFSARGL